MWVITVIAVGVIGLSFGVGHFLHRHEGKSIIKDRSVGEVAAIIGVLVWLVLIFLLAEGIISF